MTSEVSMLGPTQFERNWAMLAHLTAFFTALVGLHTGGVGAVAALLIPLGMYVYFGNRSRYVANHALQATAFQALGGIALVLIVVAAALVLASLWVITGLLSVALVGLLLIPIALLLTLVAVVSVLGLVVALVAYPMWGAYQTYNGEAFEYPVIGRWVLRALGGGLTPTPR